MAGALNHWAVWLCALAALPGIALGQNASLPDPMRPPSSVIEPAAVAKAGVVGSGLQTVILRKGATPMAVIDGKTVKLGGKVGEARLVKLSESEAVLNGPNGREVLRLTPAVEKTIERSKPAKPAHARG
jgi:MSHA biogenesis protein MshK